MKASELRIGNYLEVNDLIVSISKIEPEHLWDSLKDKWFFQGEEMQPISITEDWLLKFGFEKEYKGSNDWSNYNSSGEDLESPIIITFENGEIYYSAGEGVKLSKCFKYVHQLQNLYFALTGNELNIKP